VAALLVLLLAAQSAAAFAGQCGSLHSGRSEGAVVSATHNAHCLHAGGEDGSHGQSKDHFFCCLACVARDCSEAANLPAGGVTVTIVKINDFEVDEWPNSGSEAKLSSSSGWVSAWSSQGPPPSGLV